MNEALMAELKGAFDSDKVLWHKCHTNDELFYHVAQAIYEIKAEKEKERVTYGLDEILAKNGFKSNLMRSYICLVDSEVCKLLEVVRNDKKPIIKA